VAKSWLKNQAEKEFTPNANQQITSRERKHRWLMNLEKLFGFELSKKHFRRIK